MTLLQRSFNRFLESATGEQWYYRVGARLFSLNSDKDPNLASSLIETQEMARVAADVVQAHPNRFWPAWIVQQSLKNAPLFQPMSPYPELVNTTGRNWSEIRQPGVDDYVIVDGSGLVTPTPNGWSLEAFIQVNGQPVESASHQKHYVQSVERGQVTTKTVVQSISVKSQSVLSSGLEQEPILHYHYQIANVSDSPQEGDFYLGIRPYNVEGLSPIKEIVYLSKNAFVVDDRLALILDQKPDNIVCHNLSDGDLGAHHLPSQMILSSSCPSYLAAAYSSYAFKLAPGASVAFSVRAPIERSKRMRGLFERVFSPNQTTQLGKRIQAIQARSTEKALEKQLECFQTLESHQLLARFPEAKLTRVFKQCRQQLVSYVGGKGLLLPDSMPNDPSIRREIAVFSELLQLGASPDVWSAFDSWLLVQSKRIRSMDPDEMAGILLLVQTAYSFNLDKGWLRDRFFLVDRLMKALSSQIDTVSAGYGLVRATRSVDSYRAKEHYLVDTFTVLAGFEAATEAATLLHKELHKKKYKDLAGTLLMNLDAFLKKRQHEYPDYPIPVSAETPISEGMVSLLSAVVPLGILKPTDARMARVKELVVSHYIVSDAYFKTGYPSGLSIKDTLSVAQFYHAQLDPRFMSFLDFVLSHTTETGHWPESLHPQLFTGSGGVGCCPLSAVQFSRLSRQLLCQTSGNRLLIMAPFPEKWFEKTKWKAKVERLQTRFGTVSYSVLKEGHELTIHFHSEFHTRPSDYLFVFPKPAVQMSLNDEPAQSVGKETIKVSVDTKSVRFNF